jgi:D-alanyl-D-alanine carboxypeptidase
MHVIRAAFPLAPALALICLPLFVSPVPAVAQVPSGTCAEVSDAPPALARALDAILDQTLTGTDLGAAPGGVLSVRSAGWHHVRALGLADPDAGTPIDCAMPFQIGSNTKMMTATVLLQLHEEGRLSIDDPLSRHLPDIAARLPNGAATTLRQLARHTSGVFSYTDNAPDGTPGVMEGAMTDPALLRTPYEPQALIEFVIAHGTPAFAPDDTGRWSYSNTGYTLLGMVIERAEGLPLQKSFENRIFGPLGLTRSYLWNAIPRQDFGLPRSWLVAPSDTETTEWNMSQGGAAGGVISTVDDMHRFIEALVGGRLFREAATLALMQQTVPTGETGVGYGIGLRSIRPGFWGHGGQTMGFLSVADASAGDGISWVGWGSTSLNPLARAPVQIINALRANDRLP